MSDAKFLNWMREVSRACESIVGLSADDLPDCCFRDWFDDGVKPVAAARRAIRSADAGEFC